MSLVQTNYYVSFQYADKLRFLLEVTAACESWKLQSRATARIESAVSTIMETPEVMENLQKVESHGKKFKTCQKFLPKNFLKIISIS